MQNMFIYTKKSILTLKSSIIYNIRLRFSIQSHQIHKCHNMKYSRLVSQLRIRKWRHKPAFSEKLKILYKFSNSMNFSVPPGRHEWVKKNLYFCIPPVLITCMPSKFDGYKTNNFVMLSNCILL